MNVYHFACFRSNKGDCHNCVIIANSEIEALGMALQDYPDTDAKQWCCEGEIDVTDRGVTHISTDYT